MTNPTETTPTETTEPDADVTADVDVTPDDTEEPTTDDDQEPTGNKEAAKWRTKLRAAEAERDALQQQLDAQRRAVIDWRSSTAAHGAVDPQLLDAAGINITELLDDTGHLDMTLVDQFIDATATKFRVQRMAKPNPQQGAPSEARTPGGLADVFREDRQRTQ